MFIFRAVKKLLFWALFVGLIVWAANWKYEGRTLYQVVKGFVSSKNFDEGMKDLKMFLGGFLKSLGEEIQEDVTEEERKKLESIIKKEVRKNYGTDSNKKLQN